jgi:hypothetical protein
MPFFLGCNAGIFEQVASVVPGTTGCRSYRDTVNFIPTVWPGVPGSTKTLVSLRPHPGDLLSGALDDQLLALLAVAARGAQLTVWHEAGNLYRNGNFSYITPQSIRQMHVKMHRLCEQAGTGVGYGCVIYGTIGDMAKWVPYAPYALDWYGIDLYDNLQSNNGSSFRNADGSLNEAKIKRYLHEFLQLARDRTGRAWPRIVIPECNSPLPEHRPLWFTYLADWLYHNGGHRLYMFFKDGGPSSGPWLPDDTATINALNNILATYE